MTKKKKKKIKTPYAYMPETRLTVATFTLHI